ncbi:mandelate racemase/muconate lactonizing enzyme family protein [Phreatobacter stygius]|uniref:Mandelate racemase/muconate lactonizing enzyme family protein n=1 Tax=Phreatobacter stygius TaxID=1940610 RepID=A0A4D7B2E7_9HYPH|nr:mandelate racemase/muconate lactonizing enzyme family protein [Phreatobacter stygius]QCI67011.1 mandelate racemase/muconate lactonizing enzyme family protein [Phreatobacter stygius]
MTSLITSEPASPGADISIVTVEALALRAAIAVPVKTSFGVMTDRPAVFLRVRDQAGAEGFGEVWCNFPSVGAEHRARLALSVIGPALVALGPLAAGQVFDRLMSRLHILAIQSGEWGPIRQVAAGLDMACHDLAARKAGLPLWRHLGGLSGRIRAYASGIGPEHPADVIARERSHGHTAFKLKVGFGEMTDRRSLEAARRTLGDAATLMIDANQGWTAPEAARLGADLARAYGLAWIEEPIAADRPSAEWLEVAGRIGTALAAGENMNAMAEFDAAIGSGCFGVLQPDAAKWGGVSGCLAVAKRALAAGISYCPHYLGGGIGLMASAHLLAAAGGPGLLEIDSNPNPWRDRLAGEALKVEAGLVTLSEAPGLGIDVDWDRLARGG